jgi:hypothetical protein
MNVPLLEPYALLPSSDHLAGSLDGCFAVFGQGDILETCFHEFGL